MAYVDGYVLPVKKSGLATYRRLARKAAKIWMKYGALDYKECVADDMKIHCGIEFPKLLKLKRNETVVFAYIVYKSRAHRDRVNAKVMKDPELSASVEGMKIPFDMQRMTYGGFRVMVSG